MPFGEAEGNLVARNLDTVRWQCPVPNHQPDKAVRLGSGYDRRTCSLFTNDAVWLMSVFLAWSCRGQH